MQSVVSCPVVIWPLEAKSEQENRFVLMRTSRCCPLLLFQSALKCEAFAAFPTVPQAGWRASLYLRDSPKPKDRREQIFFVYLFGLFCFWWCWWGRGACGKLTPGTLHYLTLLSDLSFVVELTYFMFPWSLYSCLWIWWIHWFFSFFLVSKSPEKKQRTKSRKRGE